MITIALVCGTGATSSFLALRLKNAIKGQGIDMVISVCPEVALNKDIEEFDYILLGPHLSYLKEDLSKKFNLHGEVYTIPGHIYAAMDGSQLLDFLLTQMK